MTGNVDSDTEERNESSLDDDEESLLMSQRVWDDTDPEIVEELAVQAETTSSRCDLLPIEERTVFTLLLATFKSLDDHAPSKSIQIYPFSLFYKP